jgi:protein SEY1
MDLNGTSAQKVLENPTALNAMSSLPNGTTKALTNAVPAAQTTNDAAGAPVQVINEEKNFTPNLSGYISSWGLAEAGFNYDVVAVFGSQSTGKSTLLNRLFGTSFDVMDETHRRQTTKGIWMCRGKGMNVMVMDVEGTDGRERGEDQDFERKSALFSLASSEVLIVNIWEHQIGLYQGANMGLLKTVFEVNLGLFGNRGPEGYV